MVFFVSFLGGGLENIFFVIFTKLIPRKMFLCIAKILVLMVKFKRPIREPLRKRGAFLNSEGFSWKTSAIHQKNPRFVKISDFCEFSFFSMEGRSTPHSEKLAGTTPEMRQEVGRTIKKGLTGRDDV